MKRYMNGFFMSLSMFSKFPAPLIWEEKSMNLMIPYFPIVGLFIGLVWYALSQLFVYSNMPLMISSVLLMLCPLVLSGFIHMDGYMDTSDAIASRAPMEKKREILKDSHVGAFAVIAFGIYLLLAFSCIYECLLNKVSLTLFLLIPATARSVVGFLLLHCKAMSKEGFVAMFKKNSTWKHKAMLLLQVLLCIGGSYFLLGYSGIFAVLCMIATASIAVIYLRKQFGGISGDLSGFMITITELIGIAVMVFL